MKSKSLLESISARSFEDLCEIVAPVDEPMAWAVVTLKEGEYLHTDGSILSMVQHMASCKIMYASAAFLGGAVRWRDCAEKYDEIGVDWRRSVEDLHEAHRFWLDSWSSLGDDDLESSRLTIRGRELPAWRIIGTVAQHDAYHAGQIEILKSTLSPSSTPPPLLGDDIRANCRDLPNW